MTPEVAVEIVREALYLILLMVTVIITPSLIIGLMVSVFQAATQINEQTLSFLPRLLVTLAVIIVMGPWMVQRLLEYFERLVTNIPMLIG
ncbi:flagellar biosynthesis protein FliQ [Alkalimarinus alittae]|uniref:Flagellar biosynthetic protein FliQ n=1 Tax=Alkalimarinus alittae TaxID=2961619 RepID=A0ABY6MYS0_9ALTE|nr:flagellar biosynthesis protein FliQ [Alkalimarinus alittae]UZE94945.1 flagellar biosynthesis protein FliQ [Alkalimarinus alittae]